MSRRRAREIALRVLYQREIGNTDPTVALRQAFEGSSLNDEAREFARALVFGTIEHLGEIDCMIAEYAVDWKKDRMPAIDRNVLRMGLFELVHYGTAPEISISESVELARRFSTVEASKFINGILGRAVTEAIKTDE